MAKRLILLFHNSYFRWIPVAFYLTVFAAQIGAAEWYKDYEVGVSSAKKNQCVDAISRLQSSLREKPDEGANIKFYGMNFGDYFPHFYLGKCYFQMQNYQAAVAEFEMSEQQGQIQRKKDLWNQLNQLKTVAKAQLSAASTNAPKIAQVQPPPAKEATPSKSPPEPPKAKEPEPVPVKTVPPPAPIETAKKSEPAKEILPEPPPAPPEKTAEELALEKASGLVHAGARKYLQGEYDSAIVLFLEALQAKPDDVRAQFLLGCSYAGKYLVTGAQDQNFLQKASATFLKVKRASPDYRGKNSPYISPAILDIYNKAS